MQCVRQRPGPNDEKDADSATRRGEGGGWVGSGLRWGRDGSPVWEVWRLSCPMHSHVEMGVSS